jgi:hypothetical protein
VPFPVFFLSFPLFRLRSLRLLALPRQSARCFACTGAASCNSFPLFPCRSRTSPPSPNARFTARREGQSFASSTAIQSSHRHGRNGRHFFRGVLRKSLDLGRRLLLARSRVYTFRPSNRLATSLLLPNAPATSQHRRRCSCFPTPSRPVIDSFSAFSGNRYLLPEST